MSPLGWCGCTKAFPLTSLWSIWRAMLAPELPVVLAEIHVSCNCIVVSSSLCPALPSSLPYRWTISPEHSLISSCTHLSTADSMWESNLRQIGSSPEKLFSGLLKTSVLNWYGEYLLYFSPGKPSLCWKLFFLLEPVILCDCSHMVYCRICHILMWPYFL